MGAEHLRVGSTGGAGNTVEKGKLNLLALGRDEGKKAGGGLVIGDNARLDNLDGSLTAAVTGSHLSVCVINSMRIMKPSSLIFAIDACAWSGVVRGLTKLANSAGEGGVTELLVHIVCTGATIVTEPDAVVLDVVGLLLEDLRGYWCGVVLACWETKRAERIEKKSIAIPSTLNLIIDHRTIFYYYAQNDPLAIPAYLVNCDDLAVCALDLLQGREKVPEAGAGHNSVGSKDLHAVNLGLFNFSLLDITLELSLNIDDLLFDLSATNDLVVVVSHSI